jgi:hypothetical protein
MREQVTQQFPSKRLWGVYRHGCSTENVCFPDSNSFSAITSQ